MLKHNIIVYSENYNTCKDKCVISVTKNLPHLLVFAFAHGVREIQYDYFNCLEIFLNNWTLHNILWNWKMPVIFEIICCKHYRKRVRILSSWNMLYLKIARNGNSMDFGVSFGMGVSNATVDCAIYVTSLRSYVRNLRLV